MKTLSIIRPDDMHLHVRDGAELEKVINYTAKQFARAIIMPNLAPPVVRCDQARQYYDRIINALDEQFSFQPLMTLYLTDNTSADEISQASTTEFIHAVKYYPAGATTNSDSGVTDIKHTMSALEKMAETGLPLLLHGEVTTNEIDIFDREAVFIEQILEPLRQELPELKIILEHITTADAVNYVLESDKNMAATITPQHCLMNRNELFRGGLRPHHYCLPILKAEQHRAAVHNAAISGDSRFFLGTDSAPHAMNKKESNCGCAGIFSAFSAIEIYAEIFDKAGPDRTIGKFCQPLWCRVLWSQYQ